MYARERRGGRPNSSYTKIHSRTPFSKTFSISSVLPQNTFSLHSPFSSFDIFLCSLFHRSFLSTIVPIDGFKRKHEKIPNFRFTSVIRLREEKSFGWKLKPKDETKQNLPTTLSHISQSIADSAREHSLKDLRSQILNL